MIITASRPATTACSHAAEVPCVELSAVTVRYRLRKDPIFSFKEYVLTRLRRRPEYWDVLALDSVDLTLSPGESLAIVGRNGAGKSTLLKVIARVLVPIKGRVVVQGRLAPMLGLGAGFHPDLTGRENLFMNAAILGYPRKQVVHRADEVVEFSELWDFIDVPIRTYSSGMQARLGFAVATLFRPDILLLDEVLGVGDLGFQRKCLERIEDFRARGTAVVFVSHAMDAVARHCSRAAWLESGKIAAYGATAQVLDQYIETFPESPITPEAPAQNGVA